MSSEGTRLSLLAAGLCLLGLSAGCTSVPAAPEGARTQPPPQSTTDNDGGWLWKSLTKPDSSPPATGAASSVAGVAAGGQPSAATPTTSQAAAQVVPAGYVATDPSSPLIPGPATRGASYVPTPLSNAADASAVPPGMPQAGPPPTIPAEMPGPPPGGVSIKDKEIEKAKAEKKSGFEWSDLAPENIYKNIKAAAGYGPNEKIARSAMAEGAALFRDASAKKSATGITKEGQDLFRSAAAKFATVADRWPDTPLEEDAWFLQGESEFFSDQYPKAHDTYGGLLKKYVNTRHLDTVVAREFNMGRYWEQLQDAKPMWVVQPNVTDGSRPMFDTFGYAIQAYERVRTYDPTGPLADHSLMAMADGYFRRGQFEEAAFNYDLLCKEYPNSVHQLKAHLLDLQAKMRVYQGTAYDGIPLKEAQKIADNTLKQFGNKLGPEREHVLESRAQIIEEMANREFDRGQYYEQHKYYGAARLYYKGVIDSYPSTQKAKEARAQYDTIRSLPDEPPDHLKWLKELIDKR
jgi:outer membrane protein assembly factor BamD (BamD/ComL family)